jgi:hypothetical protein
MMALLRRAFFYDPAVGQVWESRFDLPPIKVVSVKRDEILVVRANIAFPSCWEPDHLAERYAGDLRQWRDRLAEERRRLKR